MTRVLVIDNYDSFVYNLVQYLGQLGATVTVVRNDVIDPADVAGFDGVLISPGPGTPQDAGRSVEVVSSCETSDTPLLGVCLGHQAIAVAHGGVVSRAPELLHGKTSEVWHDGAGPLRDLPSPFIATRYHSLAVEEASLPAELEVTGRTGSGIVMSLRHTTRPVVGVQFHPESVLTEGGHLLLAGWLVDLGDHDARRLAPPLAQQVDLLRRAAFATAAPH